VNKLFEKNPNILAVIFEAIERCSLDAVKWIKEKNWHHTGAVMNINQGLLDALGVNDETLSSLIFALRKQPDIYGAKISGSGLGDCVIGIGSVEEGFNANRIDIAVSSSGIEMIF
jgi:mevalonate kinase